MTKFIDIIIMNTQIAVWATELSNSYHYYNLMNRVNFHVILWPLKTAYKIANIKQEC